MNLGKLSAADLAGRDFLGIEKDKDGKITNPDKHKKLYFNAGTCRQVLHVRGDLHDPIYIEPNDIFVGEDARELDRYFFSDRSNGWCCPANLSETDKKILATSRGYFTIEGNVLPNAKDAKTKAA
jgi:hypothetical protein